MYFVRYRELSSTALNRQNDNSVVHVVCLSNAAQDKNLGFDREHRHNGYGQCDHAYDPQDIGTRRDHLMSRQSCVRQVDGDGTTKFILLILIRFINRTLFVNHASHRQPQNILLAIFKAVLTMGEHCAYRKHTICCFRSLQIRLKGHQQVDTLTVL